MYLVRSISKCNNLQLEISHHQKKICLQTKLNIKEACIVLRIWSVSWKRDNHVRDTMSAKLHQEENIQGKCQILRWPSSIGRDDLKRSFSCAQISSPVTERNAYVYMRNPEVAHYTPHKYYLCDRIFVHKANISVSFKI